MSNKKMNEYLRLKDIVVGYYADEKAKKPTRREVKTYIKLHNEFLSLA